DGAGFFHGSLRSGGGSLLVEFRGQLPEEVGLGRGALLGHLDPPGVIEVASRVLLVGLELRSKAESLRGREDLLRGEVGQTLGFGNPTSSHARETPTEVGRIDVEMVGHRPY